MKRMIAAVLLFSLQFLASAVADEAMVSSWAPKVSIDLIVASQYLSFGSGVVLYNAPVVQSGVTVAFQNGLWANVWNSKSFYSTWGKSFGDEIDYGVGWDIKVAGFGLSLTVTYFDEPLALIESRNDILYTQVLISREVGPVNAKAYWKTYTPMPNSMYEGGHLFGLGLSKTMKPFSFVSVSGSADIRYDDGGFGLNSGLLAKFGFGFAWNVSRKLSVIGPSIDLYVPISVHDIRKMDEVIYGGLRYQF